MRDVIPRACESCGRLSPLPPVPPIERRLCRRCKPLGVLVRVPLSELVECGVNPWQKRSLDWAREAFTTDPDSVPPIELRRRRAGGFRLLDGSHRLTVARRLALQDILADVLPAIATRLA